MQIKPSSVNHKNHLAGRRKTIINDISELHLNTKMLLEDGYGKYR